MAGIGDSWGTAQELLHPRDSHGRFRSKWKMSESVFNAVQKVLSTFRPRTFQSDGQARQYTFNLSHRKPGAFDGGSRGYARLQADFMHANEDLLDGNPDEPSTKKFVQMMDSSMQDIPDDIITSSVVPPAAFGLTPERMSELEEMTGNVIANRGYQATSIGTPLGGGNGNITMIMAVPKGTKMAVPGRNANDPEMFFDRDQEFTVSKVKPDGRGGYNMYVVATPKTPNDNPPPIGGQAGPGKPADREAAVQALENAHTKRLMGDQGESQLPGGQAAGGLPENPNGTVQTPEQQRAASRAQVLGRAPATGNEPAPAPAAPSPAPAAEPTPNAPAAPTPAPAAPAAPTPAPVEAPPAPTPSGVEPPNGATSLVTGEPATSFRDAVANANLESPSAGPRRREWNSAYMGVTSGKMHPADALRELESDIAKNKQDQKGPVGEADSQLGSDIEKQEKLADLLQSHFHLGEPKQRQARSEVESDLAAKRTSRAKAKITRPAGGSDKRADGKTAAEAARPGPLAKIAPKREGTAEERGKALSDQQAKDLEDDKLNEEQRSKWAGEVGSEPASLKKNDTAGNILLDEMADQLRNGRITRAKAAARLRDHARDDQGEEPDYLRKVADAIEADTSKPAKRVPLKKAKPKAAPDTEKVEAALTGRTEKNILTGLNAHSVGDLRALADKWGVETRGEDKKLKLKSALAKELAEKWKSTPSLQRKAEVPEGTPPADELDSMTVAQLKDYAKANGIKVTGALRKDALKAAIKKQRDSGKSPEAPSGKEKAEFEQLAPEDRAAYKRAIAKGESHAEAIDEATSTTPVKKVAKKAAPAPVKFPGRLRGLPGAAPRTQEQQDADIARGEAALAKAKKTIAGLGTPKTPAAKKVAQVAEAPGVPEPVKKAAIKAAKAADAPKVPAKKATKKLAPGQLTNDELAEASRRVLAGEDPGDVGNEITARRGEPPLGPPELPEPIKTPDQVREDLRRIGETGTLEDGKKYLDDQKLSAKDMRLLAEGLGVPVGSKDTKVKIRDNIANTIVGGRVTDRAMGRALNAPNVNEPEAPSEPKVPGIDTAERARLQQAAKEVIADMRAQGTWGREDPFPKLQAKLTGEPEPSELERILSQTHGPSGMALGDRVAVRLLQRLSPEQRKAVLAEMSEKDRNKVLDDAERMGVEDMRVRKGGFDVDRILKDAGLPQEGPSQETAAAYHEVKMALAGGDVPRAQKVLKEALARTDVRLDRARQQASNENLPTGVRERMGLDITHHLAESDWYQSLARALHSGDSPELVTKKEAKKVIPVHLDKDGPVGKATAEELRQGAEAAGIKLPETATTKDEVITELAREMIRRDKAGKKLPEITVPAAVPVKVPGKKVAAARVTPTERRRQQRVDALDRAIAAAENDPDLSQGRVSGETTPLSALRAIRAAVAEGRQGDEGTAQDLQNIVQHRRLGDAARQTMSDVIDEHARLTGEHRMPEPRGGAKVAKKAAPTVGETLARAAKSAPAKAVPAKKVAPSPKPEAPTVSEAAKEEVKTEVAKATAAPVKKAAKKAAPSAPGQYTEADLRGMNLAQIKDIEDERGIKRTSVAKDDRIKAILDHQEASGTPAPAKKVAKAAPEPKVSAAASAAEIKKVEAKPPSKAAPTKIGSGKIEAGKYSSKPAIPNRWGLGSGEIHYHTHGAIGRAVRNMGEDRALDVDGDRLDNVLGRIATDTVTGASSPKEQLEKVKKLAARLPEGSKARSELDLAIGELDSAPKVSVKIPKGTPGPLVALADRLGDIPLASGSRFREGSDLQNLQKVIDDWNAGKLTPLNLEAAVRRMWGFNHESQEGRLEVDRAILEAEAAIKALRIKKELVRPPKEE
jgi:hypothetical protein